MKFWSQKFPRQARLRSEKSLDGPRWASRQKKFLRNQKTQELFQGKPSQRPRRRPNVRQASQRPRRRPNVRQASQRSRHRPSVRKRARDPSLANPPSQRPRQPAKRQQLSQNPRHPSLIPPRVLSISRSGILHKRSKS